MKPLDLPSSIPCVCGVRRDPVLAVLFPPLGFEWGFLHAATEQSCGLLWDEVWLDLGWFKRMFGCAVDSLKAEDDVF